MNLLKILPLILLLIMIGCIQPSSKEEEKLLSPTYGLSVEIAGGNITVTKGSTFSLMISIKNNGDFDAILKRVWLLGDILYIEGNITESLNKTLHKREVYVSTFAPLTVSTTIGKNYFEFYPAICYEYKSRGVVSFYVTTSDQVFTSNRNKPLKKSSTNSPLIIDFEGFPIYRLTESEEKFVGSAHFVLKVLGRSPNSWPVLSCEDLSNASVKNVTLKIIVPRGILLKNVSENHWILKEVKHGKDCEPYYRKCLSSCNESCCENTEILECMENAIKQCWIRCKDDEICLAECSDKNVFEECIRDCISEDQWTKISQSIEELGICMWNHCISEHTTEYCLNSQNLEEYLDACIEDIIDTYKEICIKNCKLKCGNEYLQECDKEYIFRLSNAYYSYLRSRQALRDIPLSLELSSSNPIDLEEIVVMLNVSYNFYEIFPSKRSILKVV